VVECLCTAELRKLKPQDECSLEREVEWEVIKDNSEGKCFQEIEESEDDPVGEPLDIVLYTGAFDCLEGQIGRKSPSNEVGDGEGDGIYKNEEAHS